MNLLDCVVTEIVREPYEIHNKWWVKVEYTCYGSRGFSDIMCKTEEEALNIKIGHKFLS